MFAKALKHLGQGTTLELVSIKGACRSYALKCRRDRLYVYGLAFLKQMAYFNSATVSPSISTG
jgi:hypothetical protein